MLTEGCVPHPELGEPAESHLAVAAAVATGVADAGLAVRAVAESGVQARLAAMPGYDLSMSGELRLAA